MFAIHKLYEKNEKKQTKNHQDNPFFTQRVLPMTFISSCGCITPLLAVSVNSETACEIVEEEFIQWNLMESSGNGQNLGASQNNFCWNMAGMPIFQQIPTDFYGLQCLLLLLLLCKKLSASAGIEP